MLRREQVRRDLRARLHRGAAGKHLERRWAQAYVRVRLNDSVLRANMPQLLGAAGRLRFFFEAGFFFEEVFVFESLCVFRVLTFCAP